MPIWAYILIGIGSIVATIATTPLWVFVLRRPKVTFVTPAVGYWCFGETQAGRQRNVYFGIDVELLNDGNDDTSISDVKLVFVANLIDSELATSYVTSSLLGTPVAKNGGRLQAQAIFNVAEPEPRTHSPRSPHHEYERFLSMSIYRPKVLIRPSQNRRLLWGSATIESGAELLPTSWETFNQWLGDFGISIPGSQSETDSNES